MTASKLMYGQEKASVVCWKSIVDHTTGAPAQTNLPRRTCLIGPCVLAFYSFKLILSSCLDPGIRRLEKSPNPPQRTASSIPTLFLMSEPKYGGCTRLAEISNLSPKRDRFLLRENEPKDLFDEIKPYINLVGGF